MRHWPNHHDNLDDLYRDQLKEFEATPPADAWEKIQAGLPTESGFWSPGVRWSLLALLLIGITSVGYWIFQPGPAALSAANRIPGSDIHQIPISGIGMNTVNGAETSITASHDIFFGSPNSAALNNPSSEESQPAEKPQTGNSDLVAAESNYSTDKLSTLVPDRIATMTASMDDLAIMDYPDEMVVDDDDFKGLHIGPVVGMANVFHSAPSIDQLQPGAVTFGKWAPGTFFGINAGYNFNAHTGIQADWIIQSNEGQHLEEFNERTRTSRVGQVKLNYMRIPVTMVFRMPHLSRINAEPASINLLAGIQYSRINYVNIDKSIDELVTTSDYNRNEIGVTAGAEYDLFIGRNSYLTLGVKGGVNSDVQLSGERLDPFIGAHIRFNYLFKPKSK